MVQREKGDSEAIVLFNRIYEQKVRPVLANEPDNSYLAIAVTDEDYELDVRRANAVRRLLARCPDDAVFTIRLGNLTKPAGSKENPVRWFPNDSEKACRKCSVVKPSNERHFYFNWSRNHFDSKCKSCVNSEYRARYRADPEYREQMKARNRTPEYKERKNARRRQQYADDPQYREILLVQQRGKYSNDSEYRERVKARNRTPEHKERKNTRRRERYADDSQYRETLLAQQRERRADDEAYREKLNARRRQPEYREKKNRQRRERLVNDPDYREQENARRRDQRASDKEYQARQNARDRKRYAENPYRREDLKERSLLKLYGISAADVDRMKSEQGSVCAICRNKTRLGVDHDHQTGRIRGLLCNVCNLGLGGMADDVQVLSNAIAYLSLPETSPEDIPAIPAERLFARFEIPHWEGQSRDKTYRRRKSTYMKNHFGMSIDQYEALLEIGGGVCWICRNPEVNQSNPKGKYPDALAVDHNHVNGNIRGLLCANCDMGIGKFHHDPDKIGAAIEYLTKWDGPAGRGGHDCAHQFLDSRPISSTL